jgi:hypothetical protein
VNWESMVTEKLYSSLTFTVFIENERAISYRFIFLAGLLVDLISLV